MNLQYDQIILRRLLVIVLCMTLFSIQDARASEQGYTASVSLSGSERTPMSIPKFDVTDGELRAIEIHFSGFVNGFAKYEGAELQESTTTVFVNADVQLQRPDGTVIALVTPSSRIDATLPAFDGELDLDGPSGQSAAQVDGTASKTVRLTDEADLRLFTGDGEMLLPTVGKTRSRVRGPGNFTAMVTASASANVTVQYIYEEQSQFNFSFLPFINQ